MNGVDWKGKFGCSRNEAEFSRHQIRFHGVHSEISGSSFQKDIIESQRAKICHKSRRRFGKRYFVMKRKFLPPFHKNVARSIQRACLCIRRHQDKLLFHYQIDFQSRSVLRRIHYRDVDDPRSYMSDQILWDIDMDAKSDVRV